MNENKQRKKQLKAIFYKYKDKYSGKVFRTSTKISIVVKFLGL